MVLVVLVCWLRLTPTTCRMGRGCGGAKPQHSHRHSPQLHGCLTGGGPRSRCRREHGYTATCTRRTRAWALALSNTLAWQRGDAATWGTNGQIVYTKSRPTRCTVSINAACRHAPLPPPRVQTGMTNPQEGLWGVQRVMRPLIIKLLYAKRTAGGLHECLGKARYWCDRGSGLSVASPPEASTSVLGTRVKNGTDRHPARPPRAIHFLFSSKSFTSGTLASWHPTSTAAPY